MILNLFPASCFHLSISQRSLDYYCATTCEDLKIARSFDFYNLNVSSLSLRFKLFAETGWFNVLVESLNFNFLKKTGALGFFSVSGTRPNCLVASNDQPKLHSLLLYLVRVICSDLIQSTSIGPGANFGLIAAFLKKVEIVKSDDC